MPTLSQESRRLRARIAAAVSNKNASPDELAELRQQFHASSLADHLDQRLLAAPTLTGAQYDQLHAVIRRHRLRRAS